MGKETFRFGENKLFGVIWKPDNKPKAVVQICHGITEHIGRYEEFAEILVKNDIAVIGCDLPGHGQSTTKTPAYFGNWMEVVDEIHLLSQIGHSTFPNIPYIMLGFSLGSFLARTYVCKYHDVNKLILIGTGQKPKLVLSMIHFLVSKEAKKIGEENTNDFIKKLSFDEYNKSFSPNKTTCDWLCKDETSLQAYLTDSLCQKEISAGLFRELLFGMIYTSDKSNIENMQKIPILLLSGEDDPVGDFKKGVIATKNLFEKMNLNVAIAFVDGRHDILHEATKNKVYDLILDWLDIK